jgi:hypothetical protein
MSVGGFEVGFDDIDRSFQQLIHGGRRGTGGERDKKNQKSDGDKSPLPSRSDVTNSHVAQKEILF